MILTNTLSHVEIRTYTFNMRCQLILYTNDNVMNMNIYECSVIIFTYLIGHRSCDQQLNGVKENRQSAAPRGLKHIKYFTTVHSSYKYFYIIILGILVHCQ